MTVSVPFEGAPMPALPAATEPPVGRTGPAIAGLAANANEAAATRRTSSVEKGGKTLPSKCARLVRRRAESRAMNIPQLPIPPKAKAFDPINIPIMGSETA